MLVRRRLRGTKQRGYLTQGELKAVCRWKSARAIGHVRANNHHRIRAVTSAALTTWNERRRMETLLRLKGVSGGKASDLARKHGISGHTFYRWKAKYGGMTVSEAQRLRQLEDENRRLKHLVADLTLDNQALKAVLGKKW